MGTGAEDGPEEAPYNGCPCSTIPRVAAMRFRNACICVAKLREEAHRASASPPGLPDSSHDDAAVAMARAEVPML